VLVLVLALVFVLVLVLVLVFVVAVVFVVSKLSQNSVPCVQSPVWSACAVLPRVNNINAPNMANFFMDLRQGYTLV
jgi:hypothetical protein